MDKYCKEANVKCDYQKYPFGFSFIFKRYKALKINDYNMSLQAIELLNYMNSNYGILENKGKACSIIKWKEITVTTVIKELIKFKKIERIGSKKTGYWKIIK